MFPVVHLGVFHTRSTQIYQLETEFAGMPWLQMSHGIWLMLDSDANDCMPVLV